MRLDTIVTTILIPFGLARGGPQLTFRDEAGPGISVMADLLQSLEDMQSEFYQIWLGTWPDGIDWTRAVMGTHIASGLDTFTRSKDELSLRHENLVNSYFSHLIAYYFGQDFIGLRFQAFDDILWVVLGWLDSIQLLNHHSDTHFASKQKNLTWYGTSFSPAFAHRARIFWELAVAGWDETLCGGGMIWSPYLDPYKNAITNELFIAASINMYLYFAGDDNESPIVNQRIPGMRHDRKFLDAAVKGFNWLQDSKMTNTMGLYIDGFHINGWSKDSNGTGKCDDPNPMVYTYNQGVILSAHKGLWSATGNISYLMAGHELIRNVITATGWSLENNKVASKAWSGLGRNGVIEDACDSHGKCSQDGQTFKGIFFHHLTVFCQRLPTGLQRDPFHGADRDTASLHLQSCLSYASWVARNAEAAMGTRDESGVFGTWWTVGLKDGEHAEVEVASVEGMDYRNQGVLRNSAWIESSGTTSNRFVSQQFAAASDDPNDRGRGRTLETHSGGVAVLRARYEFLALQESAVIN